VALGSGLGKLGFCEINRERLADVLLAVDVDRDLAPKSGEATPLFHDGH
jgi:hypothetical protein